MLPSDSYFCAANLLQPSAPHDFNSFRPERAQQSSQIRPNKNTSSKKRSQSQLPGAANQLSSRTCVTPKYGNKALSVINHMVFLSQSYHMVFWDHFSYAICQAHPGDGWSRQAIRRWWPSWRQATPLVKPRCCCRRPVLSASRRPVPAAASGPAMAMGAMGEDLQKTEKLEGISMDFRLKDGESPMNMWD